MKKILIIFKFIFRMDLFNFKVGFQIELLNFLQIKENREEKEHYFNLFEEKEYSSFKKRI